MIGTNDLKKSSDFYENTLSCIGYTRSYNGDGYVGFSHESNKDKVVFYVTIPFNKKNATGGNGTQISFEVNSKEIVDKFHIEALKNGASDEGKPGPRPSNNSKEYYSYIRDFDGNKICAYYNEQTIG